MRRFLFVLVLACCALFPGAAKASPLVRQVSQTQAQGLSNNGAQVTVWPGSGTNIDFTRTGEYIQRAWVDDPSRVVVDFDAPLCNGGGHCEGGASFIHLRRVMGIHFANLPQTPSTLLTVITHSPQSATPKQYLFQIAYGSGTPEYAAIAITPDTQAGGGLGISGGRTANWNAVERGLHRAIAQGLITVDSPVVSHIQTLLASVRNGVPLEQAAQEADVSLAVLTRLGEMGASLVPSKPAQ